MNKYDDIIDLEHYGSSKRKPMSMENRAAQFAPFSALTGYSAAIKEKSRLTEIKRKLTDEEIEKLNNKLQILIKDFSAEVVITYFEKDLKKSGGQYIKYIGKIKKFDTYNKAILLENNIKILFNDILEIESDIFDK